MRVRGLEIEVFPGVYPPSEDTFLLMDAVSGEAGEYALELCSGTGSVGLSLSDRVDLMVCVELSVEAAKNTAHNFRKNGRRAEVILGDLFTPLKGKFDLVIMNPPYLPESGSDPWDLSWSGGEKGRAIIDRFLAEVAGYLREGGRAYLIQSSLNGIEETLNFAESAGLQAEVVRHAAFQFETLVAIRLTSKRIDTIMGMEKLKY
ncbi:MAG: methyltransferase [Candidatus Verstraetearchaeota archaeon]|nr:methyltransferase [Candidatus Verstraetearchaeota archaeon]